MAAVIYNRILYIVFLLRLHHTSDSSSDTLDGSRRGRIGGRLFGPYSRDLVRSMLALIDLTENLRRNWKGVILKMSTGEGFLLALLNILGL